MCLQVSQEKDILGPLAVAANSQILVSFPLIVLSIIYPQSLDLLHHPILPPFLFSTLHHRNKNAAPPPPHYTSASYSNSAETFQVKKS